ncbi:MAG: hypothetical protein HOP11_02205 [Saprospiraceae bacterium]|nr:hypothetical protein [Saprospiraceae bacterium]
MESNFNPDSGITIYLSDNLQEIERHWGINAKIPVLLSIPYLKALEDSKPENMNLMYGYCTLQGRTIALFQLQNVGFDAEKRLKLQMETGKSSSLSDKIALAIKLFVARKVNLNASILGNLMTAGPYGIVYDDNVELEARKSLISELSYRLLNDFELLKKSQIFVVKDIHPEQRLGKKYSTCFLRLNEFTIQPSMKLTLRKEWKSIEDYQEALESKYRTKVKKVLRHRSDLKVINASLADLLNHEEKLFELYKEVAEAAGFNIVELTQQYLITVKKFLNDDFSIKLIFAGEKLIAFYSYFLNSDIMSAHFVGYSKSQNRPYELYHNMLLYYLEDAMRLGVSDIEFARTALEIKSSLGAEPVDYYCYLAHESRFFNRIVPSILDLLMPVEEWQPRSPFKVPSR